VIFLGDFSFVIISLKNYRVTMTTTLNTFGKYNGFVTLVPEVYFYYFHCEGERKNKPLVESGN
jgi:uncharacterized protein (DUF3820 family)